MFSKTYNASNFLAIYVLFSSEKFLVVVFFLFIN